MLVGLLIVVVLAVWIRDRAFRAAHHNELPPPQPRNLL
jgi:hypothetical protein